MTLTHRACGTRLALPDGERLRAALAGNWSLWCLTWQAGRVGGCAVRLCTVKQALAWAAKHAA